MVSHLDFLGVPGSASSCQVGLKFLYCFGLADLLFFVLELMASLRVEKYGFRLFYHLLTIFHQLLGLLIQNKLARIFTADGALPAMICGRHHQENLQIEALRMRAVDAPDWILDDTFAERISKSHPNLLKISLAIFAIRALQVEKLKHILRLYIGHYFVVEGLCG